jgi:hypothetical protein
VKPDTREAPVLNQPAPSAAIPAPKWFSWVLIFFTVLLLLSLSAVIVAMIAMAIGAIGIPDLTGSQSTAFFACLGVLITAMGGLIIAMVSKFV